MKMIKKLSKGINFILIGCIKFYRKFISPMKITPCCRFIPSCSQYAIEALQKEPSEEMLAHTLTVIRRCMNDNGQLIIAVEPPMPGYPSEHGKISSQQGYGLKLKAVKTADEKLWWTAFTSFDEEVKGADSVMSTFMTDIRKLFDAALKVDEIEGVILNPWNRTIMLDKKLIKIIIGA